MNVTKIFRNILKINGIIYNINRYNSYIKVYIMIFRIYDVEFKQKKDLFLALGYSGLVGSVVVQKQYGGLENLIKTRLQLTDAKEIQAKLTELRDKYYMMLANNKADTGNYKRIKTYIYDCYLSSWHQLTPEQQETIIKTVSALNGIAAEQIKKEL